MKEKTNSRTTDDIQRRFFQAIDALIAAGRLESLTAFCEEHDLHRPKYSNLRSFYSSGSCSVRYKVVDIDALAFICADFGVSCDWLMFGTGTMFR